MKLEEFEKTWTADEDYDSEQDSCGLMGDFDEDPMEDEYDDLDDDIMLYSLLFDDFDCEEE